MNISSFGNFGIITKKIFNDDLNYPKEKFITKMLHYDNSDEIKISNLVKNIVNYEKHFCPLIEDSKVFIPMFTKDWYEYISKIKLYRDLYAYNCFNGGHDLSMILCDDDLFDIFCKYYNTLDKIKNMIIHLVRGINYLHKNNIVHNDLKLENIVCNINNCNSLKIIDFGLSDVYPFEKFFKKPLGTDGYIPINNDQFKCFYNLNPNDWIEQESYFHRSAKKSNKNLVYKTDIFSLGIVFKIVIDYIFEAGQFGINLKGFESYEYTLLEKSNYLKIKYLLDVMLLENVYKRFSSNDILNFINSNIGKCYIL